MRFLRPRFRITLIRTITTVVAIMSGVGHGLAQTPPASTTNAQEAKEYSRLWTASLHQIEEGQFLEARTTLGKILNLRPNDPSYQQVVDWLDGFQSLHHKRQELHEQLQERFLKQARENIKKEEWVEALYATNRARLSSPNGANFLQEPLYRDLIQTATEKAEALKSEGKWDEASELYYQLKNLDEKNAEYEAQFDECFEHYRIKLVYDKDEKWRQRLRGVTERMAKDALWRIHRDYVQEGNFKGLAEAGVKQLILLTENEVLRELFPAMKDERKAEEFKRRLQYRIRSIHRQDSFGYDDASETLEQVLRINEQTIELQPELIIYEFTEGFLGTLDQFSSMLWPADVSEFEKYTHGHFIGVGIQIMMRSGQIVVSSPLEDTPAFRAGIQPEDTITHIDGESAEGITLTEAVQKITGPADTEVTLTIYRPSLQKSFDVTLIREDIKIVSVRGHERDEQLEWNYIIDPDFGIAYVRVKTFSDSTTADLESALRNAEKQRARALILDLRFNPGGLLRSAIEVSELFLKKDHLIVKTEGLHSDTYSQQSDRDGAYAHIPLVVLVNEQSASASEIVSGALKDHRRALIIGERTYGKGSVQNLIPMGNTRAHLKLTTAHYYLPNGQCIHRLPDQEKWGVEPDIEVKLVPSENAQILTMWRNSDLIRTDNPELPDNARIRNEPAVQPEKAEEPVENTENSNDNTSSESTDDDVIDEEPPIELPEVDYQLETALLVLRAKLVHDIGLQMLSSNATQETTPLNEPLSTH